MSYESNHSESQLVGNSINGLLPYSLPSSPAPQQVQINIQEGVRSMSSDQTGEENSICATVLLDLDETLLHSFFEVALFPSQWLYVQYLWRQEQLLTDLPFRQRRYHHLDSTAGNIIVCVRPQMWEFLDDLFASEYNVIVWSAGETDYVNRISQLLFTEIGRCPLMALSRQYCVPDERFLYTKPLSVMRSLFPHVNLHSFVLVDNRAENGAHFPHQLIHVPDFFPMPWLCNRELNQESDNDTTLLHYCLPRIHLYFRRLFDAISQVI
jgi:hypothetical protein